jgi:prolyl-tRNA editing enzyme YbaK/EbsC (Cys-tRNA(Pro) deacylase)
MSPESLGKLHPRVAACLKKFGIVGRVLECDPAFADTAAFCARYGFSLQQSANTIIVALKGDPVTYVCCVLTATAKRDVNQKLRSLTGKKGSFASFEQTMQLTSMEIGGVTAIGIESIPLFVDNAVFLSKEIVLGGGNRVTKLLLAPDELRKLPGIKIVENLGISR